MSPLQQQVILAEPTGHTPARRALERLGYYVDVLDMQAVDTAMPEPERLVAKVALASYKPVLVLALAPQGQGRASSVDWIGQVHHPLRRCFTVIRGVVPILAAQAGEGSVVVILPSAALFSDSSRCATSVLGRCLVGLAEALRAELLSTATRVSIVIADEREDEVCLAGRIEEALNQAPLYMLPASVTATHISAVFDPWLQALAGTASDHALPPLGPMGEVYRAELDRTGRTRTASTG
ncbi:hypothetical protein [Nitrospirillum viridazoti]|uniref:Short-subunit dehydrogenase n=1 Tax=Nitrospirillum amazonense TaxID=28077 RepID=A0A560HKD3_9PROT|nr:hypothetical protein [Nitrospirillum amazonense]TWB46963.1 hypothetical protein FBZ92_14021 [Nitrospirillum amazonense]